MACFRRGTSPSAHPPPRESAKPESSQHLRITLPARVIPRIAAGSVAGEHLGQHIGGSPARAPDRTPATIEPLIVGRESDRATQRSSSRYSRSVTPGGIDAVGMGWDRATASPRGPTYLVCGRCSYAHGPIAARQSPDDGHQADHLPFKDLGKLHRRETRQNGQTRRLMPLFRAPLRNRTVDLLLTMESDCSFPFQPPSSSPV
jgi:hypothetical protein